MLAFCRCATGNETIIGSCPESRLLQKAMKACPFSAAWETCDNSMCEFSTPTFIPSRVQPLDLGNTTATVPTVNEAAVQPNNTSGELPFYDTYPGPVCFPDIGRTPMVLHSLLGVSADVSKEMNKLQARCGETDEVVFDVARNMASCGLEMFSYNSDSVYKAVGMQPPPAVGAGQKARVDPDRAPAPASSGANQPGSQTVQQPAASPAASSNSTGVNGSSTSSSSSSSSSSAGSSKMGTGSPVADTISSTQPPPQQPPHQSVPTATEIGRRVRS